MKNLLITGSLNLTNPPPGKSPGRYVYQRTAKGKGNMPLSETHDLQLRAHVIPADPKTPAQLARRAAFAAAVASWHAATAEDRESVRQTAENRGITLFNAWVSVHT